MGALALAAVGGLAWMVISSVTAPALGGEAMVDCGIVVDQSAIAANSDLADGWSEAAQAYAASCSTAEARLTVATLDPSGASATIAAFDLFPEQTRSDTMRDRDREDRLDVATAHLTDALAPTTAGDATGANVLGAIDDLAGALDPSTPSNLLVLTAGLQHSDSATVSPLVERSVDPAAAAADIELLPDLSGVDVTVVGIGTAPLPDGDPTPDWYEASLETWWTAVVTHAGGTSCHVGSVAPHTIDPEACA